MLRAYICYFLHHPESGWACVLLMMRRWEWVTKKWNFMLLEKSILRLFTLFYASQCGGDVVFVFLVIRESNGREGRRPSGRSALTFFSTLMNNLLNQNLAWPGEFRSSQNEIIMVLSIAKEFLFYSPSLYHKGETHFVGEKNFSLPTYTLLLFLASPTFVKCHTWEK